MQSEAAVTTQTIPEDRWIEFFERFSQEHSGWPVTLEVLDPTGGPEKLSSDLPLQGISFDTKGTRPSTIAISAGTPSGHVTHVIDLPLKIQQAEDANGDIDFKIEPARGPVTLVHMRSPAH